MTQAAWKTRDDCAFIVLITGCSAPIGRQIPGESDVDAVGEEVSTFAAPFASRFSAASIVSARLLGLQRPELTRWPTSFFASFGRGLCQRSLICVINAHTLATPSSDHAENLVVGLRHTEPRPLPGRAQDSKLGVTAVSTSPSSPSSPSA